MKAFKYNHRSELYLVDGIKLYSIREDQTVVGIGVSPLPDTWLVWSEANCEQVPVEDFKLKANEVLKLFNDLI